VNQGSRQGRVSRVRSEVTERLVEELGMSLAEVTRVLGGFTSAISRVRTIQERLVGTRERGRPGR